MRGGVALWTGIWPISTERREGSKETKARDYPEVRCGDLETELLVTLLTKCCTVPFVHLTPSQIDLGESETMHNPGAKGRSELGRSSDWRPEAG